MNNGRKRIVIEALAAGFIPCGLREYAFNVCPRLIRIKPDWMDLTFIVPPGMRGCFGSGADYVEANDLKAKIMRHIPMVKGDLFHTLHQICAVTRLPGVSKELMTIHDVNFAHTKSGSRYRRAERRFLTRMGCATHLSFISGFVADDVASKFPYTQPSRIIYNGVTCPDVTTESRPDGMPSANYLLHLSSLEEYKNARLLVEMMKYLPERTLVLAGNCRDRDLPALVSAMENVRMIGRVTDEEKTWLYNHCDAFLFPSKAEGFGLPPLEAMSLGKPVFLSTLTSLPEIGGEEACYFTELEPKAMARVVETSLALPHDSEAMKRRASAFSWDNTARQFIDYYSEILVR